MPTSLVRPDIVYAWKGPSLLIVSTRGDIGPDRALSGFYYREARFVSTLRLEINGHSPWLCEAAAVAPDMLEFTLVHPDVANPGGGGTGHADDAEHVDEDGIPERALDVRLSYRVGVAGLDVRATITNRSLRALTFDVAWRLGADFADIQEAQSGHREQQAPVHAVAEARRLEFSYQHHALPYRSSVDLVRDRAWRVSESGARAEVRLDPRRSAAVGLRVTPEGGGPVLGEADTHERENVLLEWRDGFARVTAPGNQVFGQTVANNIRDFASFPLLEGERDEWLTLQAGVPLYPAFFGRDALTAGWQAGMIDRGQALDAALTRLGRMQGTTVDDWRDEEPGRLPYQVRRGPLALLNLNPYAAYYADYASPLMFVISLANLFAWTGDTALLDRHWDTALRVLEWAREYGDKDRDGYLEYLTRSSHGTKNQGWKDSGDAIIYPDGSPVPAPIATCEIQGYWYLAQVLMGFLCWMRGARGDARAYRRSAAALRKRFNRDWWLDDEGYVAQALDPDKQVVRGATSNVGHCLACGIITADRLPRVVDRLFAPDMFSGWGIRTLSSAHAFYNPLSYHRGTVWAVEQATIAFGLRRFGLDARALDLATAMFELAQLYPEQRIPECIGGYQRGEYPVPGAYPRANTPQLWNNTAFPLIVQTMLGLLPIAFYETLVLDPVLPEWLPEVVVHDLRVGRTRVSLRFWRDTNGRAQWEVLRKDGTLRVLRQPPPESITAGVGTRVSSLVETLLR